MKARLAILCVVELALSGCRLVTEPQLRRDAAVDDATPADATEPDAADARADAAIVAGPCTTRCEPTAVIGSYESAGNEVRRLLDVVRVDDTLGVLVLRTAERFDGWSRQAYALLRFHLASGRVTLTTDVDELLVVEGSIVAGALTVRDGRFEAVVLRSSDRIGDPGMATVTVVGWESDDRIAHVRDLGPLGAALPACTTCTRVGAAFGRDGEAVVGVGYADGVEGGLVDLTAQTYAPMGSMVALDGDRLGTSFVSGVVVADRVMAVVGGGARLGGEPTPAFAAWGSIDAVPLAGRVLPGAPHDQPPRVAHVGGNPIVWRFVSDETGVARGAMVSWRMTPSDALEEIGRLSNATGLFPLAMSTASGADHAALVWAEQRGLASASLHVWQSDGGECTSVTAHHALELPHPPAPDHALVAATDGAGTFVVGVGVIELFQPTAFYLPNCRVER